MLEQLTVGQLLERWRDELVRAGVTASADAVPGRPEVVDVLERRLVRSLPPSYREFFAACNGMPVTGAFTQGLRPAERVGWLRSLEADWLQTWREAADDPDDPGPHVELMNRALLVSEPGDEALLLDPDDVDPTTGEWACYTFSNFAPGAARVGPSFRSGLESVYRSFLASHDVSSATLDEVEQAVEDAYQALLAGDLAQRGRLEDLAETSWRAQLLAAQFDAFGAQPFRGLDTSAAIQILWWGVVGAVSAEQALADHVLVNDLLPLWVVRLVEEDQVDWELRRAPSPVAERMRELLTQIAQGTGPIADFSYSPAFARRMVVAREQITAGDLDAAQNIVHAALPTWTPMSRNHLAPLGLYYDKDLRRLLTPRPSTSPAGTPSVTRLRERKQYSERTLAILTTPYQPSE